MNTVKIYHLKQLSRAQCQRLREAQMEAARAWNACVEMHLAARLDHTLWPRRDDLQKATKGHFALQSQSIQMVVHAFLATIETTKQLRQSHPEMQMKYPYKEKRFYPVHWPKQAVGREEKRVVLPMGRGRPSLVFPLALPEQSGACTLVWNHGFELHVCIDIPQAQVTPGDVHATVDLGEIHLAAVTTNTGKALLVTGRGIRSLKRQRHQHLGKLAKKQSYCQNYSRRWKKLQHAENTQCRCAERRIRDLRHKATRQVIDFCVEERVGTLFIGNPHGVRNRASGRHHNQRMTLWEYGKDIDYLTHKSTQAHMSSFTVSERGTSSRCPSCGHKHKPRNRQWICNSVVSRDIETSLGLSICISWPLASKWSFLVPSRISVLV